MSSHSSFQFAQDVFVDLDRPGDNMEHGAPTLLRGFSSDYDGLLSGGDLSTDSVCTSSRMFETNLFNDLGTGASDKLEMPGLNRYYSADPKQKLDFSLDSPAGPFIPMLPGKECEKDVADDHTFTIFRGEGESPEHVWVDNEDSKAKKTSALVDREYGGMSPRITAQEKPALPTVSPARHITAKSFPGAGVRRGLSSFDGRVQSACTNCRASKTKCEEQRPCQRCVRQGRGHACVESHSSKRRRAAQMSDDEPADYSKTFAHHLVHDFDKFEKLSQDDFLERLVPAKVDLSTRPMENGVLVKALADRHSRYQGQACYRNSWCIRQFKHCGHCKSH